MKNDLPSFDAANFKSPASAELARMADCAQEIGFFTVYNTILTPARVRFALSAYRAFFELQESEKQKVNMAQTDANRGWGAAGSEQVDPAANPDYKQVFDCGFELPSDNPLSKMRAYGPNLWPIAPAGFQEVVQAYYHDALAIARLILRVLAQAIGAEPDYFDNKFTRPMALLRGNYYPPRPAWAGEKDWGIATHTDYGCLTLLATDGVPGLEVRLRGGGWLPVTTEPGTFIINFGEMIEMWTDGKVKATPHRVRGTKQERISMPLFFNPNYDTNVAPSGAAEPIKAIDHLQARFDETYTHLQKIAG